jgi:hypothetical protein
MYPARVQAPLLSRYSGRQAAALQANSRRLFSFSETDYSAISGKTLKAADLPIVWRGGRIAAQKAPVRHSNVAEDRFSFFQNHT